MERTVRIPEAAMEQLKESEQEAETEAATETALEYGQAPVATMAEAVPEQAASETKSAFEKGAGFVQEDIAMPHRKRMLEHLVVILIQETYETN